MALMDITHYKTGAVIDVDVCIVGSGAAGISVAREFLGTRASILVLEGGGEKYEATSQDCYRSLVVGFPHGGIHRGRMRVLGGTTTLWPGQLIPLFDVDFTERDWVPYSGWPIDRLTLSPYYRRAEDVMSVPHGTYDKNTWPQNTDAPPNYDSGDIQTFYSQFTPLTPNFARRYAASFRNASNIRVLTHANVVSLDVTQSATHVNEAIVRSFEQLELRVRARFFVICCGGIETPRLLLNSNSVESNGIGNRHDMVGRFFQDHPTIAFPIHVIDRKRFNRFYNSFRSKGIRYVIKLAASKSLQRRARILNVGAEVYYPSTDSDSITAARTLLRQIRTRRHLSHVPRTFLTAATRVDKVALAALSRMIGGVPTSVGSAKPHLAIFCEQVPNPASRISLSTDADQLGLRRAVLDWRMTTHEVQSAQTFLDSLATEWARMGMALIDKTPTASSEGMAQPFAGYGDAYHHMGSTRMGTDPKSSVVDAQCRVHGYDNLYIGSASVFPTGGFSNPTFTLIALSLRIADQLKDNLGLPRRVPA